MFTELRMEEAMVRSNAGLGKWALRAFAFVAVAEIFYLVAGNLLLNAGFLPQLLNRDPDRLRIEWTSAWTFLPGHLRVTGLTLSGRTAEQEWWFSLGQGKHAWPWAVCSSRPYVLKASRRTR